MMFRTMWLAGAAVLLTPQALACSCLEPTLATAWNNGADLIEVTILDRVQKRGTRYFLAQVEAVYQGCSEVAEEVVLRTPVSEARCGGLVHVPGESLLVESYDSRTTYRGLRVLDFGLCGVNREPASLTRDEQAFLDSRLVTCPLTGDAVCADGDDPWLCFIDPCETAPACPDGTCQPNYCGGCNYEYFDRGGYEVCPEL